MEETVDDIEQYSNFDDEDLDDDLELDDYYDEEADDLLLSAEDNELFDKLDREDYNDSDGNDDYDPSPPNEPEGTGLQTFIVKNNVDEDEDDEEDDIADIPEIGDEADLDDNQDFNAYEKDYYYEEEEEREEGEDGREEVEKREMLDGEEDTLNESLMEDPDLSLADYSLGETAYKELQEAGEEEEKHILQHLNETPGEKVNQLAAPSLLTSTHVIVADEGVHPDQKAGTPQGSSAPRNPKAIFQKFILSQRKSPIWYLKAFGAMPLGFRPSKLAQLGKQSHRPSSSLEARLRPSGLAYQDLFLDHKKQKVLSRYHKTTFRVTLNYARGIPSPGIGAEVVERRIHVCLYDGDQYYGNVHSLPSQLHAANQKIWRFPSKHGVWLQRQGENSFLVRTNIDNPKLSLLFDLCIVVKRKGNPATNSPDTFAELCCGWCKVPIFRMVNVTTTLTATGIKGTTLSNRILKMNTTYEIPLWGGTHKDVGIHIDPSDITELKGRTPQQQFEALPQKNIWGIVRRKLRGPHLNLKVTTLKRSELRNTSTLPDTILTAFSTCSLIKIYREVLLDNLVKFNAPKQLNRSEPFTNLEISTFLKVSNDAHLLEALKFLWSSKLQTLSHRSRRQVTILKLNWDECMHQIYPLLFCEDIPTTRNEILGNPSSLQSRFMAIQKFILHPVADSLSKNPEGLAYTPFTIKEIMV